MISVRTVPVYLKAIVLIRLTFEILFTRKTNADKLHKLGRFNDILPSLSSGYNLENKINLHTVIFKETKERNSLFVLKQLFSQRSCLLFFKQQFS